MQKRMRRLNRHGSVTGFLPCGSQKLIRIDCGAIAAELVASEGLRKVGDERQPIHNDAFPPATVPKYGILGPRVTI
jgi:hypothetical protein